MNENEAIEVLSDFNKQVSAKADGAYQSTIGEMACKMAINALEEIQQYRAIGLTPQMVKDLIKSEKQAHKDAVHNAELLDEYRAIGTVEECREAVEKQMAKKPTPIDYKKYMGAVKNAKFLRGAYWCPNCNHVIRSGAYCDDCGQKLDWEGGGVDE